MTYRFGNTKHFILAGDGRWWFTGFHGREDRQVPFTYHARRRWFRVYSAHNGN